MIPPTAFAGAEPLLCELARHYGTDKGGNHTKLGTCHNYTYAYHDLLCARRFEVNRVLEIGIGDGASLRMWAEYFPNAIVIGLDNDRSAAELFSGARSDRIWSRIWSYLADQGNLRSLDAILDGEGLFDLIVDDGSHIPDHQINTANHLMKYLSPSGYYVIEDIHFDCRPRTILDHITVGTWEAIPVGIGLGGAHCECGCGGGETLLVGRM